MMTYSEARQSLGEAVRDIHDRGWAPGTGGNFSVRVSDLPLKLLMSPSGVNKGTIEAEDFLVIDDMGDKLEGEGIPSAETLLHFAIIKTADAECVLHTHSLWNNLLSDYYFEQGSVELEGFEMLKAFSGINTHQHREFIPILENSQDIPKIANQVQKMLIENKSVHGFLLRNHGLYTWGKDVFEARRHVETFEFLFEVVGHKLLLNRRS